MSTYDGNGCTYDGPSEFDLNSEVTFTFIDETGSENAGFAVWAVPDGTTTDDIQDDGILNVNGENIDWSSETQVSDSEWQLTVTFDKTGLHALNCYDSSGGGEGVDYPNLLTVSGPTATLEAYVTAYNAGDIDAVMALFSEESVITGHPFDASSTGLTEIRGLHVGDMAAAASENAYTISNVEVTGTTVTWDHVWINNQGDEFCKFGQSAVVEDGIILSWTWAGGGFDCP